MKSFSLQGKDANFETQSEEQHVTNFSGGRESTSTEEYTTSTQTQTVHIVLVPTEPYRAPVLFSVAFFQKC